MKRWRLITLQLEFPNKEAFETLNAYRSKRCKLKLARLVSTAIMVRSFGLNQLQTMFRNTFKDKPYFKGSYYKTFSENFACSFSSEQAVWTVLPRWTFIQLYQGELRRAATFFAPFFCSVMRSIFFFSLLLCYKRISSWFSCASIELWMHLGSLESTWEARVALSYRLEQLLRFPLAL